MIIWVVSLGLQKSTHDLYGSLSLRQAVKNLTILYQGGYKENGYRFFHWVKESVPTKCANEVISAYAIKNYYSYLSTEMYVVGAQKNRLNPKYMLWALFF